MAEQFCTTVECGKAKLIFTVFRDNLEVLLL